MFRAGSLCLLAAFFVAGSAVHAQIVNGDFEGGFGGGGVANGWTLFSSPGYSVTPSAESANVHGGSRAQRIAMPQPGGEGYGGIFQTINTVSGRLYRIDFWIYAGELPEAYPGEDFEAFVGFDAAGRDSYTHGLTDFDMSWIKFDPGRGAWRSCGREFLAAGPRTTFFIRGWRKWAQHGDSYFIVDDITIHTVSQTHPPSTAATPAPDPPPRTGANLLANPDFEAGFVSGTGRYWTSWKARGNAVFAATRDLGMIGGGHYHPIYESAFQAIARSSKAVLGEGLVLDSLSSVKSASPETVTIGRLYIDDVDFWDEDDAGTIAKGRAHAENCYQEHLNHPGIDAWQGYNEPDVGSRERLRKTALFEKAFTERCHELGIRSCVLNLGVGNPGSPQIAEMFRDLFAIADFVGYHAYGEPGSDLMNGPNEEWYAFRWRMIKDHYDELGWRHPPVVYTESGTYGPWKGKFSPETIATDYEQAALKMMQDDWTVGQAPFAVGINSSWWGWELGDNSLFQTRFTAWNAAHSWESRGGKAQQWSYGASNFRGGIVQAVSTGAGGFWLTGWFKYETGIGGDPADPEVEFRIGYDPTGQTADPNASTIVWSADQIGSRHLEAFVWYDFGVPVRASGSNTSIWIASDQGATSPSARIYVDALDLRAADLPPFCDVEFR